MIDVNESIPRYGTYVVRTPAISGCPWTAYVLDRLLQKRLEVCPHPRRHKTAPSAKACGERLLRQWKRTAIIESAISDVVGGAT